MESNTKSPSMDQAIFGMNLGVEVTSLYLLCCGIADTGKPVVYKEIQEVWNGGKDGLGKALDTLVSLHILQVQPAADKLDEAYTILPVDKWEGYGSES